MSPVVIVGFGALDAAVLSQALYALRDFRRAEERALRRRRSPVGDRGGAPDA